MNLTDECKKALNFSLDDTDPDLEKIIDQKILIVKAFLKGAGVKEEAFTTDDVIGVITIGVTDLWDLRSGEIKFSPVFNTLAIQLASG